MQYIWSDNGQEFSKLMEMNIGLRNPENTKQGKKIADTNQPKCWLKINK